MAKNERKTQTSCKPIIMADAITLEQAKYVKQRTHKPINAIIAEFFKNLTQIMATSDVNDCNLEYEISLFPERALTIKVLGQSSFKIGSVPEKELEAERKLRFQEVALTISEINGKAVKVTENKEK